MGVQQNSQLHEYDADAWRKMGSERFPKGDYRTAEDCYRNGIVASETCCRDLSVVLNSSAAVHLMLHRDSSHVPGISTQSGPQYRQKF
jgi:hypothetical protein